MSTIRVRVGAAVAAAALALITVPGSAAVAAPNGPANIDPDVKGSLTILDTAEAGLAAQDVEGATLNGVTLNGVEFTVQRVTEVKGETVDLATPEGWNAIDGIKVADVHGTEADAELDEGIKQKVNGGPLTFKDLPLGLYLVTETNAPDDVAVRTLPFLVTIPHPLESGEWSYSVEVLPKNSRASADKKVDDGAAFALGDTVTWTLTGSIPEMPSGRELSRYVITDALDERLEYVADSVSVQSAKRGQFGEGAYTVGYENRTLTVTFTKAGLAQLAEFGDVEDALVVEFDTRVTGLGDGTIENEALFNIGEATFEPEAVTEWGTVKIYKHVKDNKGAPLAGAVFEVYRTAADAEAGENAVTIGDTTRFETGADGYVTLPGFKAGETVYLVEVQAPAGYTASDEVYSVKVVAGGVDTAKVVEVANVQKSGFNLPALGAEGMALAGLVGVGLVGGGLGLAVAGKRRASAK